MTDPRQRQTEGGASAGREPDLSGQPTDSSAREDELRELRQVVSMLRALPDPEPPEGLTERVMERVAEIESQPWYRSTFRGGLVPVFGSALAAGIAGVLFFTLSQSDPLTLTDRTVRREVLAPTPVTNTVANTAIVAGRTPSRARRSFAPGRSTAAVAGFQMVGVSGLPQPLEADGFAPAGTKYRRSIERGLDRQLNRMLLDSDEFFQRLERISSRDRFIARLAARAARRGDAIPMALQLRTMPHRYAGPTSDEFLKASNISFASNR